MYLKAFGDKEGKKPLGAFYFPISNDYLDKDTAVDRKYTLKGIIENSLPNIIDMDSGLNTENYTSTAVNLKTKSNGDLSNTPTCKKMCISSEDIDVVIDYAYKMCERAVKNILAGDISISPIDDGRLMCNYCEYKGICNYNKIYGNILRPVEMVETVEDLKQRSVE